MRIDLLVASDAAYVPHAVTALTSACENNRQHRLRVFYPQSGIDAAEMDRIRAHLGRYGADVAFVRVDDARLRQFRTVDHLATPTYFRLLCAELLPAGIDRVLYLDGDVIVRSALDVLYATDLRANVVGAVADSFLVDGTWRARLGALVGASLPDYFNSGVMLIDVARYRAAGIGSAALALLDRFHGDFSYADQDAANVVLAGRWQALPPRWNVQTYWYSLDFAFRAAALPAEARREIVLAIGNPAIVHYTTSSKPWQFMNTHPLKREYWKYRQLTPYAVGREASP
jgi:lipopolysaccharide biosynthesis glycosyltransferase